jgi:hypothetical protein
MSANNDGAHLDWFKFENKIRKVISLCLAPLTHQIQEVTNRNEYIEARLKKTNNRIDETNDQLYMTGRRADQVLEVKDDLYHLTQTVRGHDISHQEYRGRMTTLMQNVQEKIKSLEDEFRDIMGAEISLRNEITKYTNEVIQHKVFYNDELKEVKEEYMNLTTDLRSQIQAMQLREGYNKAMSEQQKKDISELHTSISLLKSQLSETEENIIDLINFKRVFSSTLASPTKMQNFKSLLTSSSTTNATMDHSLKMLSNRLDMLEFDLRKTDNYIEKQIPLNYVVSIGEMIDYTISSKAVREKLKEFMDYKLTELNEKIDRDKGWPTEGKLLKKHNAEGFKYDQMSVKELLEVIKKKTGKDIASKKHLGRKRSMKYSTKISLKVNKDSRIVKNAISGAMSQGKISYGSDTGKNYNEDFTQGVINAIKSDMQPEDMEESQDESQSRQHDREESKQVSF